MHILIAPCSFKGSLSAKEVARHLARGFGDDHRVTSMPLSDGGEGLLDTLTAAHSGGRTVVCAAEDALGRALDVDLLVFDDGGVAVVESALTLGLPLLTPAERNPLRASSRGLGMMISKALDEGVDEIWVGLGGSATVDGGLGMLHVLGVSAFDVSGNCITHPGHEGAVDRLDATRMDPRLQNVKLRALCDISGPLSGPTGAGLYMAQKGASPEMRVRLERFLSGLGQAASDVVRKDLTRLRGAGAAGGLGMALAFLGAELLSGSSFVAEQLHLSDAVAASDLVVSGEGRLDVQTFQGKAVGTVLAFAKEHDKPVFLFCGSRDPDLSIDDARISTICLTDHAKSVEDAMKHAGQYLETRARQAISGHA